MTTAHLPADAAPADGDRLVGCLLRLGREHDPQAWALLARMAGDALARTCARIAGPELGQDALQECLLRVRRLARGFRAPAAGGDAAAMAWLQRVAATTAFQSLRGRRRARVRDRQPIIAATTADDAHAAVERGELHALLRRELARLPAAHREAVALHHLAGEPIAAVAAAQGIGEEAAKKRVQRGVAALRQRLSRCGLALAAAAVPLALADAADAAPIPDPARLVLDGSLPLATTASGALAMATAACVPAVVLVLAVWHGVAGESPAPLPAGDQPPPALTAPADAPVVAAAPVEAWRAALEERLKQQVTFDFEDTAFEDAVNFFRQVTGVNIVVAPEVHAGGGGGTVTLRAKDMRFGDALKWVLELAKLHMAIQNQAIFISDKPVAQAVPAAAPAAPPADEPWRAAIAKQLEQSVTLDFQDNDLVEAVRFIQKISGVNVVIDPQVAAAAPPLVTLRVDDMKLANVLEFITRMDNLVYVLRDEAVFITTAPPAAPDAAAPHPTTN